MVGGFTTSLDLSDHPIGLFNPPLLIQQPLLLVKKSSPVKARQVFLLKNPQKLWKLTGREPEKMKIVLLGRVQLLDPSGCETAHQGCVLKVLTSREGDSKYLEVPQIPQRTQKYLEVPQCTQMYLKVQSTRSQDIS